MADPESPNEKPDGQPPFGESQRSSAPNEAFIRALEAYQKGVSANNTEQIEAAALDMLTQAARDAEKNPTPELALKCEAGERESRGDWVGAETCYRKVLALEEATGNAGLICKAHYDLSRLFLLVGDLERADACARAATAFGREVGIFPVLVMALENQALCGLRRSDYAGALDAASQAVAAVEPGRIHEGMRAGALAIRARCRVASGDIAGGESDLAECKPILLDKEISPIFAGSHSARASWWEVTAGMRAHQGELWGACEAWAEAVNSRRHVASLGHVSGPYTFAALARTLQQLGEAFDAAGKPEAGKTPMAEARRIWCDLGLPEQGL